MGCTLKNTCEFLKHELRVGILQSEQSGAVTLDRSEVKFKKKTEEFSRKKFSEIQSIQSTDIKVSNFSFEAKKMSNFFSTFVPFSLRHLKIDD